MRVQAYVYLGWSPILAVVADGARRVLQVTGWSGGSGTAPATGLYVGATGYVSNIADAVDIRGDSGVGIDIQVGTDIITSGTVNFSNSNGVTFGISGSTITASVNAAGFAISANLNSQNTGTVNFSNSNGVTFGLSNNGVMTASVKTDYLTTQTNQTVGLYGLGNTTQNSSTTLDARTLSFNGLGGMTVGYSNGSIQLSAPQTVAQTNQTVGLYGLGNTTQNSSTTLDARSISLNGLGIVTVGYSNGSVQISATQSSVNQNASLYALGNTTQNSSTQLSVNALSFNAIGSLTVGYSNGSIQLSAPNALTSQSNQAFSAQGGSSAFQTLIFTNSNGVSFSNTNGSVWASIATSLTNINLSAGTTSNNLSAIVFSNSNRVSFGLNGSTITAQHALNFSGGTTSQNISDQLIFSNSNNVSFGLNGSTMTASVSTQPTVSMFEPLAPIAYQGNLIVNGSVSFGRINVPMYISATNIALIQHLTAGTAGTNSNTTNGATVSAYAAIYTMNGSTASLASSSSISSSFNLNTQTSATSAYGGQSGTRYRTFNLGTWNITPGDYYFAILISTTMAGAISLSQWCRQNLPISPAPGGGNFSKYFMHGLYSTTTNAMPNSVQVSEINATGLSAQQIPYFLLAGTF
jgi:hypothetical protein